MAAKGYPGDYAKGTRIEGLDEAAKVEGVEIFHAGTTSKDGKILANGGRVLNVCASGKTITEAQQRAYEAVDRIQWPEGFCRRDIGWQAVEQEREWACACAPAGGFAGFAAIPPSILSIEGLAYWRNSKQPLTAFCRTARIRPQQGLATTSPMPGFP